MSKHFKTLKELVEYVQKEYKKQGLNVPKENIKQSIEKVTHHE